MSTQRNAARQDGAVTLMVAITLVILASLTSLYSARTVLFEQLASQNNGQANQMRLAAAAVLARAQGVVATTPLADLFAIQASCPSGTSSLNWQCAALSAGQHPDMPQLQWQVTAVRDLLMSPHVITMHASARHAGQGSQAHVRESLVVPSVAPAPRLLLMPALPHSCPRLCREGGQR